MIWDWGFCKNLGEKVPNNKCPELAILEKLLWGPELVVDSSLKGEESIDQGV